MEEKVERLFQIIEKAKEREKTDLHAILKEEHEQRLSELKREYEEKMKALMEFEEKRKQELQRKYELEQQELLRRAKLEIKGRMVKMLKDAMVEVLKQDEELRKKVLRKMYEQASREMDEEFDLVCSEKDRQILQEMYKGKILVDESIEDGFVLKGKKSRLRVVVSLGDFIRSLEKEIYDVVEKKVGEMR